MGLMCSPFVERGLSGTDKGGEAPSNQRDEGVHFLTCNTPLADCEMLRNSEDDTKYVIPATSRVDNVLCGHSRIVRELVPLLFLLLLIPRKLTTAYCRSLGLYQQRRHFSSKTHQ